MPEASSKFLLFSVNCLVMLLLFSLKLMAQETENYKPLKLVWQCSDKDTLSNQRSDTSVVLFSNYLMALDHAKQKLQLLKNSGFISASIDEYESKDSFLIVRYYRGKKYENIQISYTKASAELIKSIFPNAVEDAPIQLKVIAIGGFKEKILDNCEQTGYPFAKVFLDSIRVYEGLVNATLNVQKGPLYHIDSVRLIGKARLNSSFLQHYLFLPNKSVYNKNNIDRVDKLMNDLPFVKVLQPSDLTLLGSGAVLNIYADPQKSSQANFLFGFQPNPQNPQKVQLTGDLNFQFKNLLGNGEDILLKWQQLQYKSPRLNIGFSQSSIFHSYYGFDFLFDFFKKDSSFIQLNAKTGIRLASSPYQQLKLLLHFQQNTLLPGAIDTSFIKKYKKLPDNIDAASTSMGLGYEWNKTEYNFNPRKGNIISFYLYGGWKKINYNNDIVSLKDTAFRYIQLYDSLKLKAYQIRNNITLTHFIPLYKTSTVKLSLSGAWYWSPEVFRNDLFQIGGFKSLRGFDEESIFASAYALFNIEYRKIIARNSYLCLFSDMAASKLKYQDISKSNSFVSVGAGLQYETGSGIFNLLFAVGKRNDVPINFRQAAKIHLGYVNYF